MERFFTESYRIGGTKNVYKSTHHPNLVGRWSFLTTKYYRLFGDTWEISLANGTGSKMH